MNSIIGITGATSGLGKRLVELLSAQGYQLRCLVRKPANVPPGITFQIGDITSYDSLLPFMKGLDICIHLAAQVTGASRAGFLAVNHTGTANLCRALLQVNSHCRLIHCSTISILNVNPRFPRFCTPYTYSKYLAEQTVCGLGQREGLNFTIVYPGVIFGHYDRHVMPGLVKGLAAGKMVLLKGGESRAHMIYVDDLCALIIKVCENPASAGKRYVSVQGLELGVHDLICLVAAECGYPPPRKIYPSLPFKLLADLLRIYYRLFKPGRFPSLTRSLVNVLCGSIADYPTRLDDPQRELGWQQQTSREAVEQQIRLALQAHRRAEATAFQAAKAAEQR